MENMGNKENLFFDPTTGKLCTSRPANDKAIAVDMNKQGSGGFFFFFFKGGGHDDIRRFNMTADFTAPECSLHRAELNKFHM